MCGAHARGGLEHAATLDHEEPTWRRNISDKGNSRRRKLKKELHVCLERKRIAELEEEK